MKKILIASYIIGILSLIFTLVSPLFTVDIEEETQNNLKERYGCEFVFKEVIGGYSDSREMLFSSDYCDVRVIRYFNEDGDAIYSDNYLGRVHEQEILGIAEKVFKSRVFIDWVDSSFPVNTNKDTSLKELIRDEDTNISLKILFNEKVSDDYINSCTKYLYDKYGMKISVIAIEGEKGIESESNFDNMLSIGKVSTVSFSTGEDGNVFFINRE